VMLGSAIVALGIVTPPQLALGWRALRRRLTRP
jgi:hypothetical protein